MSQTETESENSEYGKITQEAIDRMKARFGKVYPIELPFVRFVNGDSIAHAARAIGDSNPLWVDREHAKRSRYGTMVAPPALLYGAAWGSWDLRRGQGLPGVHGLHSRDRWTFFRPLLEGDEVHATKETAALDERTGKWAGRSMLQLVKIRFYNQRDEQVAICDMYIIRAEREAGKKAGKYAQIPKAVYTDEEIDQIEEAMSRMARFVARVPTSRATSRM